MARWRSPAERSSPYITPEGARGLKHELKELWQLRRREVVPALQAAAAEGDRSENAEYIYRKRQLAGIDRRIRYLSKRLDEVEVVHHRPQRLDRIHFGATVSLQDEGGVITRYRIVGADEIDSDTDKGYISLDSPMARAMLNKGLDDEVKLRLGDSIDIYYITAISYPE